jgi:hypothetical protein
MTAVAVEKAVAQQVRCPVVVVTDEPLYIPGWVVDLESFRRWVHSDDVPEKARVWYLKGEVWIDMSGEQIFSHIQVKDTYTITLGGMTRTEQTGYYFSDGLLLSNVPADISGKPDGTYFSNESLETGRVRLVEGKRGGYVELEGSPDMALEVMSDSSVNKDTQVLRQAYWEAGIREYWLVDARHDPVRFDIFRHTAKGYVATRKQDGWMKSAVFGKSFRLTRRTDAFGHPAYHLEVR